ncbi:hypothetical protein [Vibrio coralliilyticus]|uniref:hypothetical protein n=1 Tax=Vibrio coralliilyticus TaxID=190893 RepID=UPI0017B5FA40|nr:hypothetical protein [Vibrio coralliilyticus]NUW68066.1 hypothetical protein [Vibrio coralliilyticus]
MDFEPLLLSSKIDISRHEANTINILSGSEVRHLEALIKLGNPVYELNANEDYFTIEIKTLGIQGRGHIARSTIDSLIGLKSSFFENEFIGHLITQKLQGIFVNFIGKYSYIQHKQNKLPYLSSRIKIDNIEIPVNIEVSSMNYDSELLIKNISDERLSGDLPLSVSIDYFNTELSNDEIINLSEGDIVLIYKNGII